MSIFWWVALKLECWWHKDFAGSAAKLMLPDQSHSVLSSTGGEGVTAQQGEEVDIRECSPYVLPKRKANRGMWVWCQVQDGRPHHPLGFGLLPA